MPDRLVVGKDVLMKTTEWAIVHVIFNLGFEDEKSSTRSRSFVPVVPWNYVPRRNLGAINRPSANRLGQILNLVPYVFIRILALYTLR